MKIRTIVIIIVIVVFAAAAFFLFKPDGTSNGAGAKPGVMGPRAVLVNAMIATPRQFDERIMLSGSIMANEAVEIRSEVSGRIVSIGFREGQRVRKGQLLVKLFDADLQASLLKVQRQVRLDSGKVRRLQQIRTVDGVSVEELESALATYEMHMAEADIIRAQIAKTAILAPFDGSIGLRNISEGAVVSSATVITLLKDDSKLKLECTVPERYSTYIGPSTKVEFIVRGSQFHKSHVAKVYAFDPELDPKSRTLRMRANIVDASDLLPGMFADVILNLGTIDNALLVPTESIVVDIKGAKLFTVVNGKAKEVRVETGTRTQEEIRIINGLQPNDTVLTTGMLMLKDGMPVNVNVSQPE